MSATPPLIDSTMYFFSGDATWRNVMPARSVMSVKWISAGCWPAARGVASNSRTTSGDMTRTKFAGKTEHPPALRIRLAALLLLELLGEFELAFALGLAPGGEVCAAQLIVHVRLVRLKLRRGLQIFDRLVDASGLQERLAEFVARVAEVGLKLDDLAQQFDAALGLLRRDEHEAEVVFRLHVRRVQGQLALELARGLVHSARANLYEAGVVVRESQAGVERERGLQLFERAGRVVLLVVDLPHEHGQLRRVAAPRH